MPGGAVRASDADREKTLRALRRHYAAGCLEAHELEERVDRAARARFRHELRALTADLPRERRARGRNVAGRVDRAMANAHLTAYVARNGRSTFARPVDAGRTRRNS